MKDIREVLPHRYPMLHIDKVITLTDDMVVAIKNLSNNEPCFQGHFPDNPIFPGVLIVESLAQACSYWMLENKPELLPIFSEIRNAKFKKPVVPGDQMRIVGRFIEKEKNFYTFEANAYVDDDLAASSTLVIYGKKQVS